jgi:4-oxalocrotonate tautomerase
MPFIRITVLSPALSEQQMNLLQSGTTALMADGMRKPLDGIAVLVDHVERGAWRIGGKAVAVAAEVDAIIGENSNSAEEKANFMAEMMALLQKALGPDLSEQTYIVLHEMPRDSYGRGGLSRAERDRRSAA